VISAWIAQWMIPVSWVLFTIAAVVGYRHFRDEHWPQAAAWLGAYSASGLISLLHYTGVSINDLTLFQNTFVFLDIALGVTVLAIALWTALVLAGSPVLNQHARSRDRRATDERIRA
jgi:NO-binding membrane sensor protein with MHYT domain